MPGQTINRIRVMHLHANNEIFGAENNTLSLLKYLSGETFQLFLVFLCQDEKNPRFLNAARSLHHVKVIRIHLKHRYDCSTVCELAVLLKKYSIQVLHTHGYKADIIGFIASRLSGLKLVSTLHGWVDTDAKLRFNNIIARQVLRYYHKVIAISKALEEQTAGYINRSRIAYIRNAVDTEGIEGVEPLDLTQVLGINRKFRIVSYLGRLSREKGVKDLIEAASTVIKNESQTVFLFIGDGPMRNELERLITNLRLAKRVYFTGFRADALRILKASDLFVLPSLTEGISRSCMEAMGLGLLVLSTNVGGMSELIQDGVNGFLVPPQRPDVLSKKIIMLLREKDGLHSIGVRASETVREKFSMKRMAKEHEELYKRVIGE